MKLMLVFLLGVVVFLADAAMAVGGDAQQLLLNAWADNIFDKFKLSEFAKDFEPLTMAPFNFVLTHWDDDAEIQVSSQAAFLHGLSKLERDGDCNRTTRLGKNFIDCPLPHISVLNVSANLEVKPLDKPELTSHVTTVTTVTVHREHSAFVRFSGMNVGSAPIIDTAEIMLPSKLSGETRISDSSQLPVTLDGSTLRDFLKNIRGRIAFQIDEFFATYYRATFTKFIGGQFMP